MNKRACLLTVSQSIWPLNYQSKVLCLGWLFYSWYGHSSRANQIQGYSQLNKVCHLLCFNSWGDRMFATFLQTVWSRFRISAVLLLLTPFLKLLSVSYFYLYCQVHSNFFWTCWQTWFAFLQLVEGVAEEEAFSFSLSSFYFIFHHFLAPGCLECMEGKHEISSRYRLLSRQFETFWSSFADGFFCCLDHCRATYWQQSPAHPAFTLCCYCLNLLLFYLRISSLFNFIDFTVIEDSNMISLKVLLLILPCIVVFIWHTSSGDFVSQESRRACSSWLELFSRTSQPKGYVWFSTK